MPLWWFVENTRSSSTGARMPAWWMAELFPGQAFCAQRDILPAWWMGEVGANSFDTLDTPTVFQGSLGERDGLSLYQTDDGYLGTLEDCLKHAERTKNAKRASSQVNGKYLPIWWTMDASSTPPTSVLPVWWMNSYYHARKRHSNSPGASKSAAPHETKLPVKQRHAHYETSDGFRGTRDECVQHIMLEERRANAQCPGSHVDGNDSTKATISPLSRLPSDKPAEAAPLAAAAFEQIFEADL